MPPWKGIIGKGFTPDEFEAYCNSLTWNTWRPSFVVLHNTAQPSLADRPHGFTEESMQEFVSYYRDTQHWSGGPHLFCDDHLIWVFTPLTVPGVHSPSWNKLSVGVEMLGDYAQESFTDGRGLLVQQNAIAAIAILCSILGIDSNTTRLHKEDPLTTHNCPGKNVIKEDFLQKINAYKQSHHSGDHSIGVFL